ncbi:MAG: hypothetical protein HZB19_17215 [Chloroflexi bacterium]|nr:hypothetical protein [Chloroflexota bacterium]
MLQRIYQALEYTTYILVCASLLGYSTPPTTDKIENIRAFTRDIEFDYISWMVDASLLKLESATVNLPHSLDPAAQKEIVTQYLRVTQLSFEQEHQLEGLYADASILDKETASATLRAELAATYDRIAKIGPLAEAILQNQVSEILAEADLTMGGQPTPNVLYHSTPLPMALIVSPRERIEQTANISVAMDLTVDEQAALEKNVDTHLNVSSLVVPIGGIGVYPTMVMETTDIRWLLEVVSHEWTHNYLTLRPLGILYSETPELRTMNETTASIVGNEIGTRVLERFYPELMPASTSPRSLLSLPTNPLPDDSNPPPFDFRAAMHETRVTVDALLTEGKVKEAEAYMESRRLVFLENGYLLRKINQAYFAFHGAYADVPGGAAGEDPVGPAVRALRAQSTSLADFVNTISWMTSFEQLQEAAAK